MTVASANNKSGPYSTNGSTTQFPFTFLAIAESHIKVYRTDSSTGLITQLVQGTDYTLSGIGNPSGGNVIISPALATGSKITILREVDIVQDIQLSNQGAWLPKVHESFFDKITMIAQQLKEELSRCIKVNISSEVPADYLGSCRASQNTAETAKTGAETARTGAQTAKTGAETARDAAEAAAANCTNASNLTSGTVDGDRLPVMSATKKGGVPATGTPAGKFLKDDGTWGTIVSSSGVAFKNLFRNALMRIVQRDTSFVSPANGYTLDGWVYYKNGSMTHTITQDTDVPTVAQCGIAGQYSLKIDCTTADTSIAAGEYTFIYQRIEGNLIAPFANRVMTLSAWVKPPKTGVYCIHLTGASGSGNNRRYCHEYTVTQANVWQKVSFSFTLDTTVGTWNFSTGSGLMVSFVLAMGSDAQTSTVNAWETSATSLATANQVNACDSTDNNFYIFAPQLEVGSESTSIELLPYRSDLQLNQEYGLGIGEDGNTSFLGDGQVYTTSKTTVSIKHLTPLRVPASSISYSNLSHFALVTPGESGTTITALALKSTRSSKNITAIDVTASNTPLAVGDFTSLYVNASSAARIFISAEL